MIDALLIIGLVASAVAFARNTLSADGYGLVSNFFAAVLIALALLFRITGAYA